MQVLILLFTYYVLYVFDVLFFILIHALSFYKTLQIEQNFYLKTISICIYKSTEILKLMLQIWDLCIHSLFILQYSRPF